MFKPGDIVWYPKKAFNVNWIGKKFKVNGDGFKDTFIKITILEPFSYDYYNYSMFQTVHIPIEDLELLANKPKQNHLPDWW